MSNDFFLAQAETIQILIFKQVQIINRHKTNECSCGMSWDHLTSVSSFYFLFHLKLFSKRFSCYLVQSAFIEHEQYAMGHRTSDWCFFASHQSNENVNFLKMYFMFENRWLWMNTPLSSIMMYYRDIPLWHICVIVVFFKSLLHP